MSRLMLFTDARQREPTVEDWLQAQAGVLGEIARRWFGVTRGRGDDVRELLHDGQPTACVDDAAFGYVATFTGHVNAGFFMGAQLPDPGKLLEGSGKFMRHVKLRPGRDVDAPALTKLIETAYLDMKRRVQNGDDDRCRS